MLIAPGPTETLGPPTTPSESAMVQVPPLVMAALSLFGTPAGLQLFGFDQLPDGTLQFWAWASEAAPTRTATAARPAKHLILLIVLPLFTLQVVEKTDCK